MFEGSIRSTKEVIFSSEPTISIHLSDQLLFRVLQLGSCWESILCNFLCCNLGLPNWFGSAPQGSSRYWQMAQARPAFDSQPAFSEATEGFRDIIL